MKKLLVLFTVLLGLSFSATAAQNELEFDVGMPIWNWSDSKVNITGVSFDFHASTYYSDLIGMTAEIEYDNFFKFYNYESKSGGDVNFKGILFLRTGLGPVFKVLNAEKYYLSVAPVVDGLLFYSDSGVGMYFGAGVQTAFTYKIIDMIGITARVDANYYFYWINDEGKSGKAKYPLITPQVGVTLAL